MEAGGTGRHPDKRIWELDFARGACILLMVMDHALYDLGFLFRYQWFGSGSADGFWFRLTEFAGTFYFPWIVRDIVWSMAVFTFVFLCGLSTSFSHSNGKRGLRLAGIALLLTAATFAMDQFAGGGDRYIIRFGILHLLAACILIYCLVQRTRPGIRLVAGGAAILAGVYFTGQPLVTGVSWLSVLVPTTADFYSADYFTLLPWLGFFLLGTVAGPIWYKNKTSRFPNAGGKGWHRPVLFAGRHSLVVYVVHQPVVYGLLWLVGVVFVR